MQDANRQQDAPEPAGACGHPLGHLRGRSIPWWPPRCVPVRGLCCVDVRNRANSDLGVSCSCSRASSQVTRVSLSCCPRSCATLQFEQVACMPPSAQSCERRVRTAPPQSEVPATSYQDVARAGSKKVHRKCGKEWDWCRQNHHCCKGYRCEHDECVPKKDRCGKDWDWCRKDSHCCKGYKCKGHTCEPGAPSSFACSFAFLVQADLRAVRSVWWGVVHTAGSV